MMRPRLTQMEKDIGKMEEKEEFTPLEGKKIRRMKELARQFDCEFEKRHIEVLNFIAAEDTVALESEEALFDEHVDRVTEFIERLEQLEDLVGTTEPVMPHTSNKGFCRPEVRLISEAKHLSRRPSQVHDSLTKVK